MFILSAVHNKGLFEKHHDSARTKLPDMSLNICKEALDDKDLKSIANESVQGNKHTL